MNIAYMDCFSGISGDMVLGALIDAGASLEAILGELRKLPVEGYSIVSRREKRGAIAGTRVLIHMEDQPHRSYKDIEKLIRGSGLDSSLQNRSLTIFELLAKAEAHVHQVPVSQVHFHEVGALDSILDIVGSVVALDLLQIAQVHASRVPIGKGFVHTEHGLLPVPAPATVLLLAGIPVYDNGVERELVTPTGAAILAALAQSFGRMPEMTLLSTGYGVGSHSASNPPNLLRVLCGTSTSSFLCSELLLIETSIDDMNPEIYPHVLEGLLGAGALDVNMVPIHMKKNRPGVLLRVLSPPALRTSVLELLFRETTTLGVRLHAVERVELKREVKEVSTPYGQVLVKAVTMPDGEVRMIPEFEECRRVAQHHRIPLLKAYEGIQNATRGEL